MTPVRSPNRPTDHFVQAVMSHVSVIDRMVEALRRRHIRRSCGSMSTARLRDIGLTPFDVETALSLPLDQSADDALARAAAEEAAKW